MYPTFEAKKTNLCKKRNIFNFNFLHILYMLHVLITKIYGKKETVVTERLIRNTTVVVSIHPRGSKLFYFSRSNKKIRLCGVQFDPKKTYLKIKKNKK